MRAESGTCNVCSTPCSSWLHINRSLMGPKIDGFSDEICEGNGGSQYSVNDLVPVKSNACDSGQRTASETSKNSLSICDVSGAFEDVETQPNCSSGGTTADDQLPLKPQCISDHRAHRIKFEERNGLEGHEGSTSCVGRDSSTNKLSCYNSGDICITHVSHSSASSGLSSHKIDLIEVPSSEDRSEGVSSPKLLSTCSRPSSGNHLSYNPNVKDLKENLASHLAAYQPECSKGHLNSSLTKEASSDTVCRQRHASYTYGGRDDGGDSTVASDKVYLNLEAETETDTRGRNLSTEAVKSSVELEEIENVKESCRLPDVQETSLRSPPVDDGDESDILEHDVKICDICGDAGQEDLLAICCRCSDGAEHTYCMRGMTDKVPEGDWLCEECKFDDEIKNLKQDKIVTLVKKNSNAVDYKTNKDILGTKAYGKRHAENIEVTSPAKRQALEPTVGSPKSSSASRVAVLSRDSSFRNLNKGKVKLVHQSSSTCSINDTSEAAFSLTSSQLQTPPGEIKKLSYSSSVAGTSSTNGISSSVERMQSQTSLMDDPASRTYPSERPLCDVNGLPDVLSRPQESSNLYERITESSVNHSRPSITTGGRSVLSKNGKEIGHSAHFFPVDSPRSLAIDASAARTSREVMNKGNTLKAAIEAAMLKKPGIYRKSTMPDQSDQLSMSTTNLNCQINSQDQLSTSCKTRSMFSASEVHERQAVLRNSTADSCKQTTVNDIKQVSPPPSEAAALKTGDVSPIVSFDGKPFIQDLPSQAFAAMYARLKMSAIPEHECIWQGVFEVYNSGKLPELHDGIQAHLSTFVAPKVFEVANKFPSKFPLNEVPRLSIWPVQFKETGVKEDNIALYFFPKDLESYEKSYKSLMENMMKSDLALKGKFDGVELLIFPSNHLPENSRRWNMLYFLWGVFRGEKVNHMQNVSGSPKKYFIPRDIPKAIMSSPENICSLGRIDGDLPTWSDACNVALVSEHTVSIELPCLSPETINVDSDTKASSLDPKGQCLQAHVGEKGCRIDDNSLSRTQRTNTLSFQEKTRCISTPLEENVGPDGKLDIKLHPSVQATRTISGSKTSKKMPTFSGNPPNIQQICSRSFEIPARVNSNKDQVTFERNLKKEEGSLNSKATLGRETAMRDWPMKESNNRKFNDGKCLYENPTRIVSQASAGISQTSWDDTNSVLLDRGCASKKQKTGITGLYGDTSSRERCASGTCDLGTNSPMKEEICNDREILKNNGTSERYLFPMDSLPVGNFRLGENSVPWEVFSSEEDDQLPDVAPSLELALGAETKPLLNQGILPFLVGKVDLLKDDLDQPTENTVIKEEEDNNVSASLSLSLSFPFPDEVQNVKPVLKVEQLLLDRRHVNTSLAPLFDSLSGK